MDARQQLLAVHHPSLHQGARPPPPPSPARPLAPPPTRRAGRSPPAQPTDASSSSSCITAPIEFSPGMSLAVNTPATPGMASALLVSIFRIRAWGLVDITNAAWRQSRGMGMSSTYWASPVTCWSAAMWRWGCPTTFSPGTCWAEGREGVTGKRGGQLDENYENDSALVFGWAASPPLADRGAGSSSSSVGHLAGGHVSHALHGDTNSSSPSMQPYPGPSTASQPPTLLAGVLAGPGGAAPPSPKQQAN